MEERPSVGAIKIYFGDGAENGSDHWKSSVNNDQRYRDFQDEETQTKKTENGKINGSVVEGEEVPTSLDPSSYSLSQNGDGLLLETNLKLIPSGQSLHAALKEEGKGNNTSRNNMDYKNDKPSELITHEGKKEAVASLNGVVAHDCGGSLTNGYPGRLGTDNDGSGSESGYTTPKKRRAQRNGKAADHVTASVQGKAMQQANKLDPEPPASEVADRTPGPLAEPGRAALKADGHAGGHAKAREVPSTPAVSPASEVQRKNSDSKVSGKKFEDKPSKVKVVASTKEDSWTLFKPPPVFPVDNSSAKIVPKISYASKVKENLNKTSQAGGEALSPAPQVPGRPSQVPMSAVKTITSASFTNGPLAGEGNGCPLPGPHFSSVGSSSSGLASSAAGAENVASPSGNSTVVTPPTSEPRKPSLFVYPHSPSNMQLSLPSGRQADPPTATANQKSLGDIFQNQWGLSFINEPSAGPEGLVCRSNPKDKPVEVSFQGGCPTAAPTCPSGTTQRLEQAPFPKAYDLDKRTSVQTLSKGISPAPPAVSGPAPEASPQACSLGLDSQSDGAGVPGALVFCSSSSKDIGAELTRTSPAAPKLALAREQGHSKGSEPRTSWGLFDLKAAVVYHTKEMEYILNLQKQDPNRVVLYSESKNGPDQ